MPWKFPLTLQKLKQLYNRARRSIPTAILMPLIGLLFHFCAILRINSTNDILSWKVKTIVVRYQDPQYITPHSRTHQFVEAILFYLVCCGTKLVFLDKGRHQEFGVFWNWVLCNTFCGLKLWDIPCHLFLGDMSWEIINGELCGDIKIVGIPQK